MPDTATTPADASPDAADAPRTNGDRRTNAVDRLRQDMLALRILANARGRGGAFAKSFGGDRDLYKTFGYEENPDAEYYWSLYKRGDIAGRIVDLPAETTWRYAPLIRCEDEKFVDAVTDLVQSHRLYHYLQRLDMLAGVGRFGVLLLGLRDPDMGDDDGDGPEPEGGGLARPFRPTGAGDAPDPTRLLYLRPFSERRVKVKTYDTDDHSPRYGLPVLYEIEMTQGDAKETRRRMVHYTRVLHVAEGRTEDDVYGTPRLERPLNRLTDLHRLLGSSTETFWNHVVGFWHADADPEVTIDPKEAETFEEEFHEALQGVRRFIQTQGIDLQQVARDTLDPGPVYEPLVQILAATANIPARVLLGSERGQLASDQDQREWNGRMKTRQSTHADPSILRPAIDTFVAYGILPPPPDTGYETEWPPLDEPTEDELSQINERRAKTAQALAPGGAVDLIVPEWEQRTEFLGLPAVPPKPPEGWVGAAGDDDVDDDGGVV